MPSLPRRPSLRPRALLAALLLLTACSEAHGRRSAELSAEGGGEPEPDGRSSDASTSTTDPDGARAQPARTVASYDEFCDERARLECERLVSCCDADMKEALCVATMRSWHEDQGRTPSCASGAQIAPDAGLDAVNECLTLAARSYAGCRPLRADSREQRSATQACAKLPPPERLLPAGSVCQQAFTAGAQRCESPSGMFSTCTPCSDSCTSRCTTPQPLLSENQSCADTRDCRAGLVCRRLSSKGSSLCASAAADAAYCERDGDCASGACERATSVCAQEPPAIAEDRCERARALAKYGLMRAAANYWLADGQVLWVDEGKLWRAPSDGSAAPESRVSLPEVLKSNTSWRSATDGTRLWILLVWGELYELDHVRGSVRKLEPTIKPMAIQFASGVLWAASAGCEQVARDAAGAAPSSWTRVGDSVDPGAYQDSVTLGIQGEMVYCASTDRIYRAEPGAAALREVLRVPAPEGSQVRVDAFEASARDFVLVTRGANTGRSALFRLAPGATALTPWSLPDTVRWSSLDELTFDADSGRLFVLENDGLVRVSPEDGSVMRLPAANRGWADTMRSDGNYVYWHLGGVLHRAPLF